MSIQFENELQNIVLQICFCKLVSNIHLLPRYMMSFQVGLKMNDFILNRDVWSKVCKI